MTKEEIDRLYVRLLCLKTEAEGLECVLINDIECLISEIRSCGL